MALDLIVRWNGNALSPVAQMFAEEASLRLRSRVDYLAHISAPRNPRQHALVFALFKLVAENHPTIQTVEEAKEAVKVLTGHFSLAILNGKVEKLHKSISWGSMDQVDFDQWFPTAIEAVAHLLRAAPKDVKERLWEMTGETGSLRP